MGGRYVNERNKGNICREKKTESGSQMHGFRCSSYFLAKSGEAVAKNAEFSVRNRWETDANIFYVIRL